MTAKMEKIVLGMVFAAVTLTPVLSLSYSGEKPAKLEITTAAVVTLSLQLGEKAAQLFRVKDELIKIVQAKINNVTLQERFIMDTVSELKYTATIAYFEGNLLGAVLAIKKDFKVDFINTRIVELKQALTSTNSSLLPIQVAYSKIESTAALQQIQEAQNILLSITDLYRDSIEILQKIREQESKSRQSPLRQQ